MSFSTPQCINEIINKFCKKQQQQYNSQQSQTFFLLTFSLNMCYGCSKEFSLIDISFADPHNICFGSQLNKTIFKYSKTCLTRPLKKKTKIVFLRLIIA